jgi:mRNA interferase MazF
MEIRQGDVFWVDLEEPAGSESGYRRPCVVVQNDLYNLSRIHTVLVCPLTTTLELARFPENIRLEAEEGGLPKPSVIIVSQILSIDKRFLVEYCGSLSDNRIAQMIAGVNMLIQPAELDG